MFHFLLEKDALFSPKTRRWYEQYLADFYNCADWAMALGGKEVPPQEITKPLVPGWVESMKSRMADVSVNTKLRALRAYLGQAVTGIRSRSAIAIGTV